MATTISSGRGNSPLLTANIADHGTIYGGRGLKFDGVSDYLNYNTRVSVTDGDDWSLSAWVNPIAQDISCIWGQSTGGYGVQFIVYNDDYLLLQWRDSGNSAREIKTPSADVSVGVWTHVAVTWESQTKVALYINGEQKVTYTTVADIRINTSVSNVDATTRQEFLDQKHPNVILADVKRFDVALTEAQVQELYLKPEQSAPSAVQANLKSWYPMCEGNPDSPQSIVYDHSEKKLSSEKVTDPDFTLSGTQDVSTSGAYWTTGAKSTIADGKMTKAGGGTSDSFVSSILVSGKLYKAVIVVDSSNGAGTINARFGSTTNTVTCTAGTLTFYDVANSGNFQIELSYSLDCVISSISVKEVLMGNHATTEFLGVEQISATNDRTFAGASNWQDDATTANQWAEDSGTYDESASSGATEGTYFTDNYLKLVATSDGSHVRNAYLDGANWEDAETGIPVMVVGKTYRLSYSIEITAYTSGTLTVGFATADRATIDTANDKTYTATKTAATDTLDFVYAGTTNHAILIINASTSSAFTVYFDNFSIKEVGISSAGFATAESEPTIPQVPLLRYNEKMVFDGYNDYVQQTAIFGALDSGSISLWFMINSLDVTANIIQQYSSGTGYYLQSYSPTNGNLAVRIGTIGAIDTGFDVVVGKLNHLVITWNGSNYYVYVDGVSYTGGSGTAKVAIDSANDLYFGSSGGSNQFLNGIIDEISLFNTALSSTEVQELFNDGVALDATTHSKADNLLGYWRNDGLTSWSDRAPQRMLFDGSNDYLTKAVSNYRASDSSGSISAWVQCQSTVTAGTIFSTSDTGTDNYYIDFGMYQGELNVWEKNNDSETNIKSTTSINDNEIHHCVLTADGSAYKMYIDGALETLATSTQNDGKWLNVIGDTERDNINIGVLKRGGLSNYWSGLIDEVCIWSDDLSATEVTELYNLGLNGDVLTHSNQTNLISYWKNEGITNALWEDRKGSDNLTVSGSPVLIGGNNGTVSGSPESIIVREGLNSNKDGLGFPFKNADRDVLRLSKSSQGASAPKEDFIKMYPDSPYFNPAMEMTVMCWAKNNASAPSANQTLISKYDSGIGKRGWNMMVISNKQVNVVFGDPSDGSVEATTNTTATVSGITSSGGLIDCTNWYHYCFTYSAGTFITYVNATVVGHSSSGTVPSTLYTGGENANYINIGTIDNGNDYFWDGLIDEVFFYDKALSPTEISKNYKHGKGKHKN